LFLKDDEEYDEQFQHSISTDQQSVTRRTWDDDFVLKRQFSGTRLFKSIVSIESFFCLVLLPAFDGRPGRTNINATQDITVPTTMTPKEGRNRILLNSITNRSCLFFLKATQSKRISAADAAAAANMTLYIRGPTPSIPGVDISLKRKHLIYLCILVKRNRYRDV